MSSLDNADQGRLQGATVPTMLTRRRLIFIFPGFEPLSAEATARRFLRGIRQTAPLYELAAETSEPVAAEIGGVLQASSFNVRMEHETSTETMVVVYGLDAINRSYSAQGTFLRIARGFLALGDFLMTGTFGRFMRTSWRYGLFFLFPIVVWCAVAALGIIAFRFFSAWSIVLAAAGATIITFALLWMVDRQFHLLLLMDDWSFARDLARRRSEWLNSLTAAINADVLRRIETFRGDEVLFAAHSLGAVPAVGAMANALRHQSGMEPRVGALGLMTVGSSLLKIALHPAAGALREEVEQVVRSPHPWLDVQSVADPISFYHSDPVGALGLCPTARVRVMRISFRKQLTAETYKRMRLNWFKLHRQFVRAVEKRSAYSFHIILCGPAPFASVVHANRTGLGRMSPEKQEI